MRGGHACRRSVGSDDLGGLHPMGRAASCLAAPATSRVAAGFARAPARFARHWLRRRVGNRQVPSRIPTPMPQLGRTGTVQAAAIVEDCRPPRVELIDRGGTAVPASAASLGPLGGEGEGPSNEYPAVGSRPARCWGRDPDDRPSWPTTGRDAAASASRTHLPVLIQRPIIRRSLARAISCVDADRSGWDVASVGMPSPAVQPDTVLFHARRGRTSAGPTGHESLDLAFS